jgi:glycyl-tRNA synthetase alpha subunit
MYSATAGVGSSLQRLERFPDYQNNQLLILAGLEMTIAYNLLEARWKIWHSIFWKRSHSATKFAVSKKLEGIAFDANTSIINAGKFLNEYYDLHGISDRDRDAWIEIIRSLTSANRWLNEQFGIDCTAKQLKIDL